MRIVAAILAVISVAWAKTPPKLFPATQDSVPMENRSANAAGLRRYDDRRDIEADTKRGVLVPIPCSGRVPAYRRVVLRGTRDFYDTLNRDAQNSTLRLVVDSGIRSRDDQRVLRRRNHSATDVDGERASSHERGTTFDLSKRMSRGQYRWLLWRLAYYKGIGRILVIEERSCIHVFVIPEIR